MVRHLQELYQYRSLLFALTARELKARYRGSVLGFLWTFLNPTLMMLIYAIVFGVFFHNSIPEYPYFLFVGLLPWLWFTSSVGGGASTISDRRDLLTKVRFPAQVLPSAVVATNLCNYLLSLPLMLALGLLFHAHFSVHILLFPIVLVVQLVFTLALSFIVSALNVAFRDLQHVVNNLLQFWFFATPVLYSVDRVPAGPWRWVLQYGNPMAVIVESYRDVFYYHQAPDPVALSGVLVLSVLLLWAATQIFEARREEFAELI
jgi:lipopolysaccharide transport system permease protein